MKITMYELFGLMLKRQAPKKIEVLGFTMNYVKNAHWGDYEDETTGIRLSDFRLNECLNDEVEIIEEKTTQEEIKEYANKFLEAWIPVKKQFGKLFDEIARISNEDELEKDLEEQALYSFPTECGIYRTILNKLKELKEGK